MIGRSGRAPGAVEQDDFDARVEQIKSLRDRFEVAIGAGYDDGVADVGQEAERVAAALGGDDGESLDEGLVGDRVGVHLSDHVEQGGGSSLQLGEVGHRASPDDGLQGPSGEGESPVGYTRPAPDRADVALTIDGRITVPPPGHPAASDHGLHTYRTESVSLDVWQRPGAPCLELRIGEARGEIALTGEGLRHLVRLLAAAARAENLPLTAEDLIAAPDAGSNTPTPQQEAAR